MSTDEKPPAPSNGQKDATETFYHFAENYPPGAALTPRYKILKLLGVGGMGRVYLVHDSDLNVDVALKIIRPELVTDDTMVHRFKNELLLARKVSHRNVVRIHDIGEIDHLKYLSMTYIEGKSLRDVIRQSAPLSVDRALSLFTQICEGVAAAHDEGVVHRDLKPSNIMVDPNDRVYVTDFGLALSLESADLTMSGSVVGTPAYFSPEQARGQFAHAGSDIYVLGLILFELLTGELPYDRDNVDLFRTSGPFHIENKLKKHQASLSDYLVALIRKCLQPNPEFRYRTVRSLLQDLHEQRVTTITSKKTTYRFAAAAVVILVLGAGFWLFSNYQKKSAVTTTAVPPQPAAGAPSVVVLPFLNKTGKQDFDWIESAAGDLLITGLSNSGRLRVVSADRVFQTMEDLKLEREANPQDIKRIAEILDTRLVVQGSLTQAGSRLRADVKLMDAQSGHHPTHLTINGNKPEDLFSMIDQVALQIHQNLQTEPVHSVSPPIPLTTLKTFEQGNEFLRQGDLPKSITLYQAAIRETPHFARAYLRLSEAYDQSGDPDQAIQTLETAMQIQNMDPRTSFMIRSQHALLTGDVEKAIRVYQEMNTKYPNDPDVLFELAMLFEEKGDLKNAVASLQELVKLDSNHPQAYFHLGKDTILMGEAETAISKYLLKALSIHTQLGNQRGEADVLNAMGVAYERLGRYDDAIRYYNDSITVKQKIGNKKGVATSLNNIAKIYVFQSDYDKAMNVMKRAAVIFEELHDAPGIAGATNMFGVIHEDRGNYPEALRYYKEALKQRKELGNDQQTAQSYDNIGQIYYLMGQNDNAQVYWEQALTLRKAIGEESGLILSLQNIGVLQMAQGRLDKALKSFVEALDRSRAIKYENAIAVSLGSLGNVYQIQGRYAAAEDSYRQAIQILENLKDKKGVAEYTKQLGSIFLELNNISKANEILENVRKTAAEIDSVEIVTDTLILLAHGARLTGKYEEARKHLDEAMRNASKFHYERAKTRSRIEQGLLLAAEGNQSDARAAISAAAKSAKELSDARLLIESKHALAVFSLMNKDYLAAIQAAESAIPAAKKMEAQPLLLRLYFVAGEAHAGLGQKEKALEYFKPAASIVHEIQKASKPEQLSDFTKSLEVQVVYDQLR